MSLADRCDDIVRLIDDALRELPELGGNRLTLEPERAACAMPDTADRETRGLPAGGQPGTRDVAA